ncbi:DNA-3-methyladenine glycosylase 2 family protein [Candidatus Sumerlaeota bacterium]|nr:DNA-3-methyladenine glycosylase 2 family protein [Candidatus Sumerlaeota bacterium]
MKPSVRLPRLPQQPRLALRHLRLADSQLARAIDHVGGFAMPTSRPATLYSLCRAIIGQQLSTTVAGRIAERFVAACGQGEDIAPKVVLKLSDEQLRAVGLSGAKARSVRSLAEFWHREELTHESLEAMPDDELIDYLTQVKGIGPWTVKMILIFCLRRPDVLPHEDLGVRAGIKKIYRLDQLPTPKETITIAEKWAPYRSVASWYCWRVLPLKDFC